MLYKYLFKWLLKRMLSSELSGYFSNYREKLSYQEAFVIEDNNKRDWIVVIKCEPRFQVV